MPFFVYSKSSIYDAPPCVPLGLPANSRAYSPVKFIDDGADVCTNGSLSIMLVSHWLSFLYDTLKPTTELLSGSSLMLTFVVSGFSLMCCSVPPIMKSLLNVYSQFMPSIVLR